jgi:methylase of polypeptide subunit release factors
VGHCHHAGAGSCGLGGVGSGLSPDALQVAMGNAQQLGASVRFQQGSWYQPLGELAGFDLIVSIRHISNSTTIISPKVMCV